MSDIAFYITAHGYGHGVRSCDLLNTFHRLDPDVRIRIVTELPEWFIKSRLCFSPYEFRSAGFDVGMVQKDSVQVDLEQTALNLRALCETWDARVKEEAAWVKDRGVQLVVSDIPAIPLEAAALVCVPSVALGNFHWGWIYEEFVGGDPVWQEAVDRYLRGYALCDCLLRFPFSAPMDVFREVHDVPLVAVRGKDRRVELARRYGVDPCKQWVLLSFTTLDVDAVALSRMAESGRSVFFTLKPLGWDVPGFCRVDPMSVAVRDVFASVDVVLTKPGFGVLSDCRVNNKPIIYVERRQWREYGVLVEALRSSFRALHLPAEKLYSGDLQEALDAVGDLPAPQSLALADGGEWAAELIDAAIGY